MRTASKDDVKKYAHYLWWRFGDGSFDIPERSQEYFTEWASIAVGQDFLAHLHEEGAVAA